MSHSPFEGRTFKFPSWSSLFAAILIFAATFCSAQPDRIVRSPTKLTGKTSTPFTASNPRAVDSNTTRIPNLFQPQPSPDSVSTELPIHETEKIKNKERSSSIPAKSPHDRVEAGAGTAVDNIGDGRNSNGIEEILEHPLGETRFQFFLYDHEGNFIQRWITLQQIQDLLLSHRVRFVSGDHNEVTSPEGSLATAPPSPILVAGSHWDQHAVIQRPDVNIDGVVDTVHKVMADEMANTEMTESTTSQDDQELVTLSSNIIQQLIREQFFQFVSENVHAAHANQLFSAEQPSNFNGTPTNASAAVGDFMPEEQESDTTEPILESTEDSIALSSLEADEFADDIAILSATLLNDYSQEDDYIDDSTIHGTTLTTGDSVSESTTVDDATFEKDVVNSNGEESSIITSDDLAQSTTLSSGDFDFTTVSVYDDKFPSYTLMPKVENDDDFSLNAIADDVPVTTEGIETLTQTSTNLISDKVSDTNNSSSFTTKHTTSNNLSSTSSDTTTTETEMSTNSTFHLTSTTNFPGDSNSTENLNLIAYSPNDLIDRLSVGDYEFPNYLYNDDYENAAAHFSNVLPPSQMATDAFQDNMDFHDDSDLPENYDYYSQKIYLDSDTLDYYEKQYQSNVFNVSKTSMLSKLEFPDKDVAASYHPVEVKSDLELVSTHPSSSTTTSDTYLAAANPVIGSASSAAPDVASGPETLQQLGVSVPMKTNILSQAPPGNLGLEETTQNLSPTIKQFIATMNDVAFKMYRQGALLHRSRNFVLSPLNLISVLSMLLLGSRGNTSTVLADLLKTDDFRNFNPHLLLKNIRADIDKKNVDSNIAFSTHMFVELPRRNSVHSLDFFKQTIDYFYGSTAEEADWSTVGTRARTRVNEAITNQTEGRVTTFLDDDVTIHSPFSIVSSALMQSPWSVPILESDLFDMSFIRFPSAERRLVRTIGISKQMTVNAGYSKEEDATVAEIPLSLLGGELSMILVLPGEQKSFVANGLKQIESRLTPERWSGIMRSVVPHSLTVQVPLFRHRSYTDVSKLLKLIGLDALFKEKETDYSGVNSIKSLHLADVVQLTEFHSCLLENSSFSFRSASFPSSSTPDNSEDAFRNKHRISVFEDGDESLVRGSNPLNTSDRNESALSPSWRLLKDTPGFDDEEFKLALNDSENVAPNYESTNSKYSISQVQRERRKKIFPAYSDRSGENSASGNALLKIEKSKNKFDVLNPPIKTPDHNPLSLELRHRRNTGELSRKKRNPDRRKHARNEKGPTVAFDRAFMYVIRHNPTGLILHIGRYLDPI